jgi:hypothetical protein
MKFRTLALVVLVAICASVGVSGLAQAQGHNPISITQCFITEPKPMSKKAGGTQIDYVNTSMKTASKVIFAVGYRNAQEHFLRKVTDIGSFGPGQPVAHHFSLYNDVTYAGKQPASCSAISVTFADGSSWIAR